MAPAIRPSLPPVLPMLVAPRIVPVAMANVREARWWIKVSSLTLILLAGTIALLGPTQSIVVEAVACLSGAT